MDLDIVAGTGMYEKQFSTEILASFQNHEHGKYIKTCPILKSLGMRLFNPNVSDEKKADKKKNTAIFLRNLDRLAVEMQHRFKESKRNFRTLDMFERRNINELLDTIVHLTHKIGKIKHGSKLGFYFSVVKATKYLRVMYLHDNQDNREKEVEKFHRCFTDHWDKKFKPSDEALKRRQTEILRLPQNQADEATVNEVSMPLTEKG